jgi:protein-disulfide isomerase
MPLMMGHNQRLRGSAPRRARRSLRPAPSSWWTRGGLRAVAGCVIVTLIVALVLLLTSQRSHIASRASAERLQGQREVTALFAGVPQHGVILGQPRAPVTLQVFVDLEDHGDGTRWLDAMLPPIVEKFVRTNVVRLEFHSFKSDTLNRRPFYIQQVAALAAGVQNRLWNYVATFMNEQGREFTNYVTEGFLTGIAEQIPGLNLAKWEQSRTLAMAKIVETDLITAREMGFHDSPSFRIGLTGGRMKNFVGRNVEIPHHKYVVRTTPSGERYIDGESSEWQHPVSLVDAIDLKKAVKKLI